MSNTEDNSPHPPPIPSRNPLRELPAIKDRVDQLEKRAIQLEKKATELEKKSEERELSRIEQAQAKQLELQNQKAKLELAEMAWNQDQERGGMVEVWRVNAERKAEVDRAMHELTLARIKREMKDLEGGLLGDQKKEE